MQKAQQAIYPYPSVYLESWRMCKGDFSYNPA